MSSTLTSDMVRGGLRPFIERAERPNGPSPDEARELLANHEIPLRILEAAWERARRMIDRGVERSLALNTLRELIDILDECIRAFGGARAKAAAARLAPGELAALEAAAHDLGEMRDDSSRLRHSLETLPPLDPSSLPAAGGEAPAIGYVGLDDLAASAHPRQNCDSRGAW
jgi:hypothetical protein